LMLLSHTSAEAKINWVNLFFAVPEL
jgi:hypothetical protein